MRSLAAAPLLLVLACAGPSQPTGTPTAVPSSPQGSSTQTAPLPTPPCERIAAIEVHKSRRMLRALCTRGAAVEMTVALGREPLGDKLHAGDLRTPEGRYRIAGEAKPSRFHAFVPIDYPSLDDADRALRSGRIGARDHARIARAHARGERPPSDTPLGGDIGFHGEGDRWAGDSAHLDWTFGCIAVSDRDLDFLISHVEPGVSVEILP